MHIGSLLHLYQQRMHTQHTHRVTTGPEGLLVRGCHVSQGHFVGHQEGDKGKGI